MADDNNNLDDLFEDMIGGTGRPDAASSAEKPAARITADEAAEDARFVDLVDGTGDLFTHAVNRIQQEGASAGVTSDAAGDGWPEEVRSADERAAFELLHQLAFEAETLGDEEARAERLADAKASGVDVWPQQHLAGREHRLDRNQREEREIVAGAMVRQLGQAGQAAANDLLESYLTLTRMQQTALLALAGDDRSARRATASAIVRVLPTLGTRLFNWMEGPDGAMCEREGLALATILDRHALAADLPHLAKLGTEVLMLSLQAPLTRIVDLAPARIGAVAAAWGPALKERQAVPARVAADPAAPLSAEATMRLRLLSAGIAPLPLAEGRLSLMEPARRVAAALARALQSPGPVRALDRPVHRIDAQIEPALFGLGLLLAGVEARSTGSDRALLRAANTLGQQHLGGTTNSFEMGKLRRIEAIQRKRADEVKMYKRDLDEALPKLETARAALAKLGLDESGAPLGQDDDDAGEQEAASFAAIVCPKIEVKGNTKVKEAVAGHEHMLGQPIALAPVGDLPARRRLLIAEFPWATEVVDFILSDLVSRQAVTIRPVLLTGDPGSGKSHFARRFADHFGLHVWSVDCGGADGSVFAGTDRRWHSAEPSHPFLAMSRGRQANPLVLLDELEKAPTRADYARLWDGLLSFLDPGSNRAVQDKCLQVPVDCSHINYIATANRIDLLPWPLRDRLRRIAFPEPAADHLDALIAPLTAQLAASRSLDPRFIAPLTGEEHTVIKAHWRGGSVRRLARLIEAVVNARERTMPLN